MRTTYVVLMLLLCAAGAFAGGSKETGAKSTPSLGLQIVAAENFYGNIASQLVGPYGTVRSILSDPAVDPHEYLATVGDAEAVSRADLVIENGGGYDDWMRKLLSAVPNAHRQLVKAYDIAPVKLPDNEHVWYSVDDVKVIAAAITAAIEKLDPTRTNVYQANLQTFVKSLATIQAKMDEISSRYGGTPVGLTEIIFLYQSQAMGLKVPTPFSFEKAIAEGSDPPANAALVADNQIKNHQVRVLIYNEQTVNKITTNMEKEAQSVGIPIVPVTETMPLRASYQTWMLGQLIALEKALGSSGGNAQ